MKTCLHEVEKVLKSLKRPDNASPWLPESYIGGGQSKLVYLNLKIPQVRTVFKKGFSFSVLPADEQWPIWDYVWKNSRIFEVMLLSSYFVAKRPVPELFERRRVLFAWLERVDNWAHSDELSSHYSKILEFDPKVTMPVFKKWSSSKNPWYRRQALVGLLFYARFRKSVPSFAEIMSFVERHIEDEHYYVQKGVGWTLREAWNVYPKRTFAYLKANAHRIPPAGWTAATEKLSKPDKDALLEIRRRRR